ncbi:hypothetical protein [Streptomyces hiroshimensis]|uniref:Uncharacterized protein n=1 Tax=Streptomyces hiroshimensis TaxID=66424 RepID=A0ABQ2Z456_9ACTN|nr:hypothetical protein [Streptomyces hiroshimensis]GGY01891.1 hypothetical protein GCM10010324_55980 [Streptomyces hiroshimensis]
MRSYPALLFALLAAVGNALATVLQRRAARTVPLARLRAAVTRTA